MLKCLLMVILNGRKKGIPLNSTIQLIIRNSWFELIIRWFLGITFIYASYHKIILPDHFAKIIYGYYLFPHFFINLIAIILPFIELATGASLILGIYPRSAIILINGMLFCFIIALSINIFRGHEFDCGCFSFGEKGYTSSAVELLFRDIVYFFLGLYVVFFNRFRRWCFLQSGSILSDTWIS